MSALSQQDVQRIADLARLELTPEELSLFTQQLSDILVYVEQIQSLDTSGVEPTSHVLNRPVDREDLEASTLPLSDALANAPESAPEAGLFKVPRVMG